MSPPGPWPGADAHADKRPFLLARAKVLAALRGWFADQGFIETDVGALTPSPGAETHLAAFATEGGYLHTSPEFAMKQLLACGEARIFRLGAAYRKGDRSALHAPEFTLLEWYRAGANRSTSA
jgi:elongation factor P--(R)-beta-lysine ligase